MESGASQNGSLLDQTSVSPETLERPGDGKADLATCLNAKGMSLGTDRGEQHALTMKCDRGDLGKNDNSDMEDKYIQTIKGVKENLGEGDDLDQALKNKKGDLGSLSKIEDNRDEAARSGHTDMKNAHCALKVGDDLGLVVNSDSEEDSEGTLDSETEIYLMEVIFKQEADLPGRYLNCKKNPGHVNFIPVNDFNLAHLPPDYQEPILVELVQEQAKLAVRLKVKGSSPHRPLTAPGTTNEPYPFSGIRFRKVQRYGSGWIQYILKYREQDMSECPCSKCQQSGEPRKVWTKIKVVTAAHVVYDIIEARNCTSQLFYDSENVDLTSCPTLTEAIEVEVEPLADTCFISYAIHDIDLANLLDEIIERYKNLCRVVRDKFKPKAKDDPNMDLSQKLAHLYERCSCLCAAYGKLRDKMKEILEGDPHQQWQIYCAGRPNVMDNLDGIGASLLDNILQGGSGKMAEKTLTNITDIHEQNCILLEQVGKLKDRSDCLQDDKDEMEKVVYGYTSFLELVKLSERQMFTYKATVSSTKNMDIQEFQTEPVYDPSHPLTIIVSHPHGCSKKITIGKVIEKDTQWLDITTAYRYDNATCPGCSGSQVYVLGRAGAFMDHAHSGASDPSRYAGVQINESALHQDM